MQAQVKDELQELQPVDGATQKSVTDWLMHVISGKQQPAEERLRAVTQETAQPDSIFALDPPPPPKEMNGAVVEAWNGAFTAEDLCGAPVIPLPPRVEQAASETDEITANDVCWVPEERRLKPQPMVAQAPPQAAPMATDLDITREPAPRFARATANPVAEEQEITAADISRQWVIDEMEQAAAVTVPPEPEPEPEPEQLYVPQLVPQLVPTPTPVQEEMNAPEPIAAVAAEPEFAPEPEMVPEPLATPADNPFATPADNPFATSADNPFATPADNPFATPADVAIEAELEPTPVLESVVAAPAEEPQAMAAEVEMAQAEPETVIAEVEGKATETAAAHEIEMPEFSSNGTMDGAGEAHAAVAEPAAPADEKVWAKGGYWEGMHPAVDGTEQPIIEGQVEESKIEKRPGASQQQGERGYFGSYLAPEDLEEIEKAKPEGWSQSWRTLIRLGAALPWLSRALPALEPGMGNHPGAAAGQGVPQAPAPGTTSEDVAGMRLVQYEIRSTVQDHSTHLKRMEEQLARVRESVESNSADRELAEDVQSAMKLLKVVGIGLGGLLVILIVLALVMVMKH